MIKYLLKDSDAGVNLSSYKAPVVIKSKDKFLIINSVELIWNVSGTADAEFDIILSNDKHTSSITKTIIMDNSDNRQNSTIVKLYPLSEYVSVNYKSNSVTSGSVSVCLNYTAENLVYNTNGLNMPEIYT